MQADINTGIPLLSRIDEMIDENCVITYRDLNESAAEQTNYLRHMGMGDKVYTQEGFDKPKDFMGLIVLQTSIMGRTPQEIYEIYKKRWTIETYYNYFKNKADYGSLYQQDYYKTQGHTFIMLVSSLIRREFEDAVKAVKVKSAQDCLLDARMVSGVTRLTTTLGYAPGAAGISTASKRIASLTNTGRSAISYDASGQLFLIQYDGQNYFYARNAQGDIIGMVDANGSWVVEYKYDAWGKLLSTTGTLANTLGVANPYR
jgi:YD repeat-containing protein